MNGSSAAVRKAGVVGTGSTQLTDVLARGDAGLRGRATGGATTDRLSGDGRTPAGPTAWPSDGGGPMTVLILLGLSLDIFWWLWR